MRPGRSTVAAYLLGNAKFAGDILRPAETERPVPAVFST